MTSSSRARSKPPELLLALARIKGDRAVYGALMDITTYPGTIWGIAGPLQSAASRRRFLAGAVPTDPARAAWGQRQRWAFPILGMCWAPALGNEPPAPTPAQTALPKTATYRQEYVHCGKDSCTRCQAGPGHGPYWYAYWREEGRLRKRYLGKTPPPPCSAEGGDAGPSS